MITSHTTLLNALIEKYGLKSYLEIGVQNPANNFDKIKCYQKVGVDPEINEVIGKGLVLRKCTSDEYFEQRDSILLKSSGIDLKFDLIFIDGLHHADQVKRDFENSLRCLSDNGFIVIHDCLPENEEGTKVPRETKVWWGDVYKFCMGIGSYRDITYKTFNIDNGCMLVWKQSNIGDMPNLKQITPDRSDVEYNWDFYKLHGSVLMNVTADVNIDKIDATKERKKRFVEYSKKS